MPIETRKSKFWASSRILILSFLLIILVGTALLMLPQAVNDAPLSFIDAFFTATSATCVTGLIVVDTGTKFTFFGQSIILLLIQLGGLGIMTISTFLTFLVIGKFTLSEREIIEETITQAPFKNIAGLLKTIFFFTIIIELIGALFLTIFYLDKFSFIKSLYYGIFHSISAFCNAGFSLFSNSFMDYQNQWHINGILMLLIISGGIGFIVLNEIRQFIFSKRKRHYKSLSFHSKIVITSTLFLIITGAFFIFIFEYNNNLLNLPLKTKIITSIFQSVTCRTAGFNTLDISLLTNATLFFMIILMFIGASPGSCGGGIKTTTASVVIAMLSARFRNQEDINIAYRRLPNDIVSKAISVTFFSLFIILLATIILMISEQSGLSHIESRGLFLETLFEIFSAFGTVGLSTGITSGLTLTGKLIIIIVMFIGRIGPLTIALAIGKKESSRFKYAQEKLLIG